MNNDLINDFNFIIESKDPLVNTVVPLSIVSDFIEQNDYNNIVDDANETFNYKYNSTGYKKGYKYKFVSFENKELIINYESLFDKTKGNIIVKYNNDRLSIFYNDFYINNAKVNSFHGDLLALYDKLTKSFLLSAEKPKIASVKNSKYLYVTIYYKGLKINNYDKNNYIEIKTENNDIECNDNIYSLLEDLDCTPEILLQNLFINISDLPIIYQKDIIEMRNVDINHKYKLFFTYNDIKNINIISLNYIYKLIKNINDKHDSFVDFGNYLTNKYNKMMPDREMCFFMPYLNSNAIQIKYFDNKNIDNEYEIKVYKQNNDYHIEGIDELSTCNQYNELKSDLKRLYDEFVLYSMIEHRKKEKIDVINNNYLNAFIDINDIILSSKKADNNSFMFQLNIKINEINTNNYTNSLLNNINKNTLLSHVFVKIKDCPECLIADLNIIRQIQIINKYETNDNKIFDKYLESKDKIKNNE